MFGKFRFVGLVALGNYWVVWQSSFYKPGSHKMVDRAKFMAWWKQKTDVARRKGYKNFEFSKLYSHIKPETQNRQAIKL